MDIDSSPTLISPCTAYSYEDDDPPTMPLGKSAPPPSEIPVVDEDILEDSEPATLRSIAPSSAEPGSRAADQTLRTPSFTHSA